MFTKDIIQNKSNLIHNNEFAILGEYKGINNKCLILHKVCGYEWEINLNNHLNHGKGCPVCYGNKRLNIDDIQLKSDLIHNNEYTILDFKSTSEKSDILHMKCGKVFNMKISSHIHSKCGCPHCAGNKKLNIDDIKNTIDEEYVILSESYINNLTNLNFRHKACGKEFSCSLSSFRKTIHKCPHCFRFRKLNIKMIKELSDKLHNKEYEFIGDYVNSSIPVLTLHKVCGYTWHMWILNHLSINKLSGCPNCFMSIGEKKIQNYLISNTIKYEIQKEFVDCKNIKCLSFDFYLPDYNICIEYDGEQHFRPIEFFGGLEKFQKQLINDKIKTEYCLFKKIELVRINYTEDICIKLNYLFYKSDHLFPLDKLSLPHKG